MVKIYIKSTILPLQTNVIPLTYIFIFFPFYADSVYSERYMGQPDLSGNFRGYQESNIIQKFKNPNVNNGTTKKVIQHE